jgi:hypothetical protein
MMSRSSILVRLLFVGWLIQNLVPTDRPRKATYIDDGECLEVKLKPARLPSCSAECPPLPHIDWATPNDLVVVLGIGQERLVLVVHNEGVRDGGGGGRTHEQGIHSLFVTFLMQRGKNHFSFKRNMSR